MGGGLEEITDNDVRRMLNQAGGIRMAGDVPDAIRLLIQKELESILERAVGIAQHARRQTVSANDVRGALPVKMA